MASNDVEVIDVRRSINKIVLKSIRGSAMNHQPVAEADTRILEMASVYS
jgi:hypothetical protein